MRALNIAEIKNHTPKMEVWIQRCYINKSSTIQLKKKTPQETNRTGNIRAFTSKAYPRLLLSEEINPKPKNPLITAPKKAKNTIKIVPKGFPPTNKKHIKTERMKSTPIMLR